MVGMCVGGGGGVADSVEVLQDEDTCGQNLPGKDVNASSGDLFRTHRGTPWQMSLMA